MFRVRKHSADLVPSEPSQVAYRQARWPRTVTIIAIVICVCALVVYASNPAPTTITITCPSTSTPVQLGSGLTHGHTFVFMGFKANRTTNTSNVWILNSSVNDSPGVPLTPGQIISFNSARPFDASDFWIDAETANDGVVVWVQDR